MGSQQPLVTSIRPYQEMAIAAITSARDAGKNTALIVQPTGTGKTITFGELTRRWDVPTLILAHREELLTQARDKLLALWPDADIGIVGAGYDEMGHHITVGSVQSVVRPRRLARIANEQPRLVIVDEAHHTAAKSYQDIIKATDAGVSHGAFLLGVTATPDRGDKKSLDPIFGEPVYVATLPEMVLAGFLCNMRGIQIRTDIRLGNIPTRGGDFAEKELAAAVNREDRNELIVKAYVDHAANRQALVFAVNVQHAHDLADMFSSAGISVAALSGATPREERHHILTDYMSGKIQVVCNCAVLTEGFDAPQTSCVILARPTQSRALYVQMVGRGTRIAPGKDDCLVIDITDNSTKHSLAIQSLPKLVGRAGYAGSIGDSPGSFDLVDELTTLPASGRIVEREVALLSDFRWEPAGGGHYRLRLPKATLWLKLHDTGYVPGIMWADGTPQRLSESPMQLGLAQMLAEQSAGKIAQGRVHLVDRRATWRQAPASLKQLQHMRKLGIKAPHDLTKGQASDLIDAAYARNPGKRPAV